MYTERLNTNRAKAKQAIRAHIVDYLETSYKDYKSLQEQLDAIKDWREIITDYQATKEFLDGGAMLIYYTDIEKFLLANNLTTQKHLDKFGNDGAWEFYKHLIAREMQHAKRWYDVELEKLNTERSK